MQKRKLTRTLIPWLPPIALLVVWQISGDLGWYPQRILPTPVSVLKAGYTLLTSGELARHLAISFQRALLGFLIGGVLGLTLGVWTGASRIAESLIDSTIQMLRTIPHLALIPLVILWFGVGETAKVFLVALGVLFPVYLNTHYGIRSVDPGLIEMGKVYGLGRWQLFRQILLPGAMPAILDGVRFALGVMWQTLIIAETIAATSGIGYLAMNAREFLRTDIVILSIVLYALLGKGADSTARLLEKRFLQWHHAYASAPPVALPGETS
ncbi:MAG TPA: aliphatic sulfonate ABC transporter permease SsuC [Planctomicrobium sp.]|nr:aliphatic sulfonate ABC transporter permease SsuC [Planctomicrobium sp.]